MFLEGIWPCPDELLAVYALFLPVCGIRGEKKIKIERFLTAAYLSSNVEGSIVGNNFKATGRRNSMKGTIINTEKGMSRSKSCVVRFNC